MSREYAPRDNNTASHAWTFDRCSNMARLVDRIAPRPTLLMDVASPDATSRTGTAMCALPGVLNQLTCNTRHLAAESKS